MEQLKNYFEEAWGTSVAQLVKVILIVFAAGVLYANNNAKLDALGKQINATQSQNLELTQELKETNRELAKLSEALVEVRTELRMYRRSQ